MSHKNQHSWIRRQCTVVSCGWWPSEPGSWELEWGALLCGGMVRPGLVRAKIWICNRFKFQQSISFTKLWLKTYVNLCPNIPYKRTKKIEFHFSVNTRTVISCRFTYMPFFYHTEKDSDEFPTGRTDVNFQQLP